jgi:hypothetical protein
MTGRWSEGAGARTMAQALFQATFQAESVLADLSVERGVAPSDLAAVIDDPGHPRADEVDEELRKSHKLRADFDHLLRRMARYSLPRLAAASSGAAITRTAEGCRITLRPSRADPTQIYVIIEADGPAQTLFVRSDQGSHVRHPLPSAQDGVVQLLAEEGSDLVAALRDVESEVFLR